MGLEGYNVWIPPTAEQRREALSTARDRLIRNEASELDRDLIRAEHRLLDIVQAWHQMYPARTANPEGGEG